MEKGKRFFYFLNSWGKKCCPRKNYRCETVKAGIGKLREEDLSKNVIRLSHPNETGGDRRLEDQFELDINRCNYVLMMGLKKQYSVARLQKLREDKNSEKIRIIWTNGIFCDDEGGYPQTYCSTSQMSNGDVYEKAHNELDFEFLGNIKGREWRVQTNVYGNGSTSVGREERYRLWFDPTEDFHRYAILWSHDRIVFYIDETLIREVVRTKSMGAQFPSKPMSFYATIWDGSSWATSGGRYKVNYKYAPFVAEFADLMLHGCAIDTLTRKPACAPDNASIHNAVAMSSRQRSGMERFRTKHMTYSYYYDRLGTPCLCRSATSAPRLSCSSRPARRGPWTAVGMLGATAAAQRIRHPDHHQTAMLCVACGSILTIPYSARALHWVHMWLP